MNPSNARLNLARFAQMTPTAAKLYEYVASRKMPTPLDLDQFRQLCGVSEGSTGAWSHEVERACRELVSSAIVKRAWVDDGAICYESNA